MMKDFHHCLIPSSFLCFMLLMCSCNPPSAKQLQPAPKIDADEAFQLLKTGAAIVPRHSGSPGAAKTVKFISEYIEKLHVSVKLDKWNAVTPAGKIIFCNVIADIIGKRDGYIIVACHYDAKKLSSVPNFAAANDGASGVAVLLAMIKAIKNYPTQAPVSFKFVFFDGEECFFDYNAGDGLFGSRYLAKKLKANGKLKDCHAVIVLDMIGDKNLNITIPADSDPKLAKLLFKVASVQQSKGCFSKYNMDIIDDHTPFQRLGVPAIDIIDFNFGKGNRYWHTAGDTVDKTSRESLKVVGNVALQLIWNIR